jgi:hypothetical protein
MATEKEFLFQPLILSESEENNRRVCAGALINHLNDV